MKLILAALVLAFTISAFAQTTPETGLSGAPVAEKSDVTGTIAKPPKKSNKAMKDLTKETKKAKKEKAKNKTAPKAPEENPPETTD